MRGGGSCRSYLPQVTYHKWLSLIELTESRMHSHVQTVPRPAVAFLFPYFEIPKSVLLTLLLIELTELQGAGSVERII